MRDSDSEKFAAYMTYSLYCSNAYQTLKPAAKNILGLLYFEIEMFNKKRGKKKFKPIIRNADSIKMPYSEIKDRLNYGHKAIWAAFKEIMAHGFIEIMAHGGFYKGSTNVYKISEAWRTWMPGQIINDIGKNGKIGWQKKQK